MSPVGPERMSVRSTRERDRDVTADDGPLSFFRMCRSCIDAMERPRKFTIFLKCGRPI